jgi:hypothetical protein
MRVDRVQIAEPSRFVSAPNSLDEFSKKRDSMAENAIAGNRILPGEVVGEPPYGLVMGWSFTSEFPGMNVPTAIFGAQRSQSRQTGQPIMKEA